MCGLYVEFGDAQERCASNVGASIDGTNAHQIGEHRGGLFIVHWQFVCGSRCLVAVPAHMVCHIFCVSIFGGRVHFDCFVVVVVLSFFPFHMLQRFHLFVAYAVAIGKCLARRMSNGGILFLQDHEVFQLWV